MILLLSRTEGERSTEDVIDWLNYLEAQYYRLNGKDIELGNLNLSIKISNDFINTDFSDILVSDLQTVNVVWYRRWIGGLEPLILELEKPTSDKFDKHRASELLQFSKKIFHDLKGKYWLSKPKTLNEFNYNKLDMLMLASKTGIQIPDSLVTSEKNKLLTFFEGHKGRVITKAMSEAFFFEYKNKKYSTYTAKVTLELIERLPNYFFPSLIQEEVDKEYEIRSFFLINKFYSMAIFSSRDKQTSIDYRRYNMSMPNRWIPYKLPTKLEEKLTKLMHLMNLNTGSIDLIKSIDGLYYFLEVNPVGQFGMVSFPCRYNLEKEIASALIYFDRDDSR